MAGERAEWTRQYKECAADAKKDGEAALAAQFEGVAAIEASHERRFQTLLNRLQGNALFTRPEDPSAVWRCRFCGHIHTGTAAPDACPVCGYPQTYFEINATNY